MKLRNMCIDDRRAHVCTWSLLSACDAYSGTFRKHSRGAACFLLSWGPCLTSAGLLPCTSFRFQLKCSVTHSTWLCYILHLFMGFLHSPACSSWPSGLCQPLELQPLPCAVHRLLGVELIPQGVSGCVSGVCWLPRSCCYIFPINAATRRVGLAVYVTGRHPSPLKSQWVKFPPLLSPVILGTNRIKMERD